MFTKQNNDYVDAVNVKNYLKKMVDSRAFPASLMTKRLIFSDRLDMRLGYKYIDKIVQNQYFRHPISRNNGLKKYVIYTTNLNRFEDWKIKTQKVDHYAQFYAMSWHFFKLKVERFFFKQLGVRMHVWFLNIWDIFMGGIDSYWQWFKFEDQRINAITKKGFKYLIERREEAKFYLRSMALTLTFSGGVRLYIDKITVLLKQYRNNWAFITHTMDALRLCSNFFWFRFFLNYKVTLQGKIGGFLRAEKKVFKKGNVVIEDKSAVIAYHRTFPRTKYGVYSLSFWLQYRIPNLIGLFNEMEFTDTMKILLETYTIPWLSSRLSEIIETILREKEIKEQLRFNQYKRRKNSRIALLSNSRFVNKKNIKYNKIKI